MDLNADFSQLVVVHGADLDWVDSPMAGVQRRMLDRIGDEVARATTIVRYAPNSHFSPHVHTGGEEFLVLSGVFQDEHGDFPAGSYIRNPPQSSHTPGSDSGCIIFVKLWQFDMNDRTNIRTHIDKIGQLQDAKRSGVQVSPLFQDERETVRVEQWQAEAEIHIESEGGVEIFVIEGSFEASGDHLKTQSWLRAPDGKSIIARVGPQGAKVWVKSGHLRFAAPPSVSNL